MKDYHSIKNNLEELDIVKFNRDNNGLLKDCVLIRSGLRRKQTKKGGRVCSPSECPKRRMSKPIHEHANGLWGF